jgi:hypothetical protein
MVCAYGFLIALGDAEPQLAGQPCIELILGHRLQQIAAAVGARIFRIPPDVDGFGGDGDLVHCFPRPLEIRATRLNDAHLRIGIALPLVGRQRLRDRIVERGCNANALRPAKAGFHRAFVLVDRVEAADQIAGQKPDHKTDKAADQRRHGCFRQLNVFIEKSCTLLMNKL